MSSTGIRPTTELALALVLVAFAACQRLFFVFDSLPPSWDQAGHMTTAAHYHDLLVGALEAPTYTWAWLGELVRQLIRIGGWVYPPLFPFFAGCLLPLGSLSLAFLSLANLPFVVLLAVSALGIARQFHRENALVSVVLLLSYPIVFAQSRTFMLDLAAVACASSSAYLLLRSERFARLGFSVLFGASLGIGALVKQTAVVTVAPLLLYVLASVGWKAMRFELSPGDLGRRALRCLLGLAAGGLIAGAWYLPKLAAVLPATLAVSRMSNIGISPWDAASFLWPIRSLVIEQMGVPFACVFVLGAGRLVQVVGREKAGMLIAWLIGLYLIAVGVSHKTDRQLMGALIPIAVVSAIGLSGSGRWSRAAVGATCVYAAFQLLAFSLPAPLLAARVGGLEWTGRHARTPRLENWRIEEALSSLPAEPATIAVISDHWFINGQVLDFYARSLHLRLRAVKCRDSAAEYLRDPLAYDYFVTKTDWVPRPGVHGNPFVAADADVQIDRAFEASKGRLTLRGRFPLPDGSEMLLYQHPPELAPRGR